MFRYVTIRMNRRAGRAPARRARPDPSSRAAPALGRRAVLSALGLAVLLPALAACADGTTRAQENGATVPGERSVVAQRADQARSKGDTAAPIRILEVSDFECPYCKQYYDQTWPGLDSLYVQTGKVRYVWIAFPNPGHRKAFPAIEAAFCAGAAGSFWPMHDMLFEHQAEWTATENLVERFVAYADSVGVDTASFRECLLQDMPASLVAQDYGAVVRGGVQGTPFFVIGEDVSMQGAQSLDRFRTVLDSLLREQGVAPPGGSAGGD